MIETARDLAGEFDVRNLVFADRYAIGTIDQDVCTLQQRIAEKTVGGKILVGQFFLLVLVRRNALEPSERRDHRQQQMQFRVLRHPRLDEQASPATDRRQRRASRPACPRRFVR